MNTKLFFTLLMSTIITSCMQNKIKRKVYEWPQMDAPVAAIKPHIRSLHGDTVVDNYYWLNDYFKKGPDSSEVIKYLEAENAYTDSMMSGTKKLQSQLFDEMKGRIKEQDESVPYFKNGYYYYTRTEEGKQYFKFCRKKENLDAPEEILLDVDALAEGHSYYAAGGFNVSPDNRLLAYGVDTVSRRQYTIHVKNLETGETLKDAIPGTSGGSVWANDNRTLFYTKNNPATLLTENIMRHTLGADTDNDAIVYHESDNTNYIGVGKAKSGKFIYIYSSGTLSSETRYLDADDPMGSFTVFQPRMPEVLYSVTALADRFLIVTNQNAKNFKLMECPFNQTGQEHWKEVIPHRPDVLLEDVDEFKDFLVVSERKNGLIQLAIRNLKDGSQHYLDFGEEAYTAYPSNN
ncbi:MAG: S9 family peptidase, partial [Parapedobacter sp.]